MRKTLLFVLAGAVCLVGAGRPRAEEKKADAKLSAQEFVTKASAAGLAEVNLGNLAKDRASSPHVKDFAQHMVTDHTKANAELLKLADAKGLKPASRMDETHEKLATKLAGLKGADFDKEYMKAMVKDHEDAVSLFEHASKGVDDKDLQAWAGKTLPTLKEHLEMAKKVAGSAE